MEQINILSQSSAILLTLVISIIFVIVGIIYSNKYQGLNNYLVANRSVGTFSLTASLVASALGAWILFGPASAATWGGIGAVIGYALGTAFPLFILIYLGKKFRILYPKGKTLIEVIRIRFGSKLFKLILFLSIFYMTIFLIAEVTAVSILIKYISGTDLWITALIVIVSSLIYTLYGGLRASIFTDNIQFIVFCLLLLIGFSYIISFNSNEFNFEFIKLNKPNLLSSNYIPNFTAGLTFFIAVAATNLFHQGNWQRVYAAKNNNVLKKSLIISFIIIIPVVFLMGFSGLVAVSFVVGAICSALAGFIGMKVATKANVRTTQAAKTSLGKALEVAFSGGSVMGLGVVGLGVLGLSSLLFWYQGMYDSTEIVLNVLTGFSLGASSIALFARVGGGIYTKAADVGADLVGKVEAGIPEDHPLNPATIADNVGDNVGDVAGMGADLFESYVGSIIGTMVLGSFIFTPGFE